jgi:hypothetical protein
MSKSKAQSQGLVFEEPTREFTPLQLIFFFFFTSFDIFTVLYIMLVSLSRTHRITTQLLPRASYLHTTALLRQATGKII